MTWVDGVVMALLSLSAILAFFRGLVQEVLGVGAWLGAAILALAVRPTVAPLLTDMVQPPWLADALATGAVFLIVLVTLKLIIGGVARRVQDSSLGSVDRALGLVFGVARGAFLVVVAYILAGMVAPAANTWPAPVREARALPIVADAAGWLVARLPPRFQPGVVTAPGRPGPGFDELLRPPARNRN
jgi:membrane protein required for colicin V production